MYTQLDQIINAKQEYIQKVSTKLKNQSNKRYQSSFYFFQSKSINVFVANRKTPQSIWLKDTQFLDDFTNEYLKKYYPFEQSIKKHIKIVDYYQKNILSPKPILILVRPYQNLKNRQKKLAKLKSDRQKSLIKFKQQHKSLKGIPLQLSYNLFLQNLDKESQQSSLFSQNTSESQIFDSSVHDVYKQYERDFVSPFLQGKFIKNILNVQSIKKSNLLIDFKNNKERQSQEQQKSEIENIQLSLKKPMILFKQSSCSISIVSKKFKNVGVQFQYQSPTDASSFIQYYSKIEKRQTNLMQKYLERNVIN